MEIEIIEKKENPLFNRKEIKFKLVHPKEATPKRDAARDKIAEMNNVKKEQVLIDALNTTFGKGETFGYAKIYSNKEELMKNERDYHLVRHHLKEKVVKKKEDKKAEPAKKPDAKKEEPKKEEPKKEG